MTREKYKPKIVCLDFESNSLEYWSPLFQVTSAAFAWRGAGNELKTLYTEDLNEVEDRLQALSDANIPVLVHNLGFEYGVTKYVFPHYADSIEWVDLMRLGQVWDNLGDKDSPYYGSSLVNTCYRVRPDYSNHKEPFYEILKGLGVKKGQEGENLHLLSSEDFEAYNVSDVVETLLTYETIAEEFARTGYDWRLDHSLYVPMVKHVSMAQARGALVDREKLKESIRKIQAEIDEIDESFKAYFKAEIEALETIKREEYALTLKTERGQESRRKDRSKWCFKTTSTKDLERLFIEVLGLEPTFRSPKGRPSFKAAHLPTYGEGGKILAKRGKRKLVLKQCENLLALSESGRWHMSIKPTGAATGRLSGGEYEY